MAEASKKWKQNVPGAFYVDDSCIDCNLCSEIAPANFAVEAGEGHDFVFKQPADDEELALCKEALESCPVEAIGNDGEAA
jgi:ferredoxin